MDYFTLLLLGLPDVIVLFLAVLTITLAGGIYWVVTRRYNTDLQQFYIDTLVNEHDQAIALLSEDDRIVLTNKGFDELIGLQPDLIKGKKLQQLSLKQDLIDALSKSDDKIKKDGASQVSYNQRITRFKTIVWLNIQKRRIYDKAKERRFILLLITDITEKKKVEERLFNTQIEYQQLVESANDIIYRTDIAGNMIYTNAAITNILGYDADYLRKINIKDIVVEEDLDLLVNFFTQKLNEVNGEDYIEFRAQALDGSHFWLGQKTTLITSGDEVIGLQSVARDITARIEAEQELLRAKEIAENASDAKSNFISSLSHEFRTPLNAILGYSQILERNNAILPDEKGHISEIKDAGEKLLSMVDDILELSNLEARHTKAHEERMLLRPFMDNYAHRFTELAKSKGLAFEYKPHAKAPDYVVTDFTRLSLVLKNVLDNAVKFTTDGSIYFNYEVVSGENNPNLIITITDSGIGIPEKQIAEIYQPFWQSDPLKNTGTGLGLTLSERIVGFLGGEITVQNNEKEGVTVSITIPIEVAVPSKRHELIINGTSDQKIEINRTGEIRVLIVDDLLPNRTITRIILHENGFSYKEAEDGLEALSMIEEYDPDVILMDINMPVMDGIEAMLKIRSTDWKYQNMPIIAVTAGAMGGRTELLEKGFSDFLQKPYKEDELLTAIEQQLDENIASFFKEIDDQPEEEHELSATEVADFIHNLESTTCKSIHNIIEKQYFEKLTESYFLERYPTIAFTGAIQKLIVSAQDYDYLFLANVVKRLKEYADIKP